MNYTELFTAEAHEAGSEMQVKDQFGKDTGMYLTLAGLDSKLYTEADSLARKAYREIGDNLDDIEVKVKKIGAETLAHMTIGWKGFKNKGKKIKFSKKRAAELYFNAPYIADKATAYIEERRNFMKG